MPHGGRWRGGIVGHYALLNRNCVTQKCEGWNDKLLAAIWMHLQRDAVLIIVRQYTWPVLEALAWPALGDFLQTLA